MKADICIKKGVDWCRGYKQGQQDALKEIKQDIDNMFSCLIEKEGK